MKIDALPKTASGGRRTTIRKLFQARRAGPPQFESKDPPILAYHEYDEHHVLSVNVLESLMSLTTGVPHD
jgi:hypothetical protein